MKKYIIPFLVSLLTPIASFSQTTYPKTLNDSLIVITPLQLKQTNLIFVEHCKLKKQVPELENKILYLNKINKLFETSDSIKSTIIKNDSIIISIDRQHIKDLNKQITKITKKKRNWIIGGFSLSAIFASLWLLK